MTDWICMPFGVVCVVGRGMGALDAGGDRWVGSSIFGGKCGTSYYNQWGLCGIVILCRVEWRRSSSQIILGFLGSIQYSSCRRRNVNSHHSMCSELQTCKVILWPRLRWGGKLHHLPMAYSLSNNMYKKLLESDNYCKKLSLVVGWFTFLKHSVRF